MIHIFHFQYAEGEKHSLQSLTFERLGHCAVIVEDGIVTVEEFPDWVLPENDVVIELVEVTSSGGAVSVGGVGVAPWTKATSCKSSPRIWMLNIGVQEGRWQRPKGGAKVGRCFDHLAPGVFLVITSPALDQH